MFRKSPAWQAIQKNWMYRDVIEPVVMPTYTISLSERVSYCELLAAASDAKFYFGSEIHREICSESKQIAVFGRRQT
jgi:hypothetical protein